MFSIVYHELFKDRQHLVQFVSHHGLEPEWAHNALVQNTDEYKNEHRSQLIHINDTH